MEWFNQFTLWFHPDKNSEIEKIFREQREILPTLWLLGKTGAGKSSLIQVLTGNDDVQVGNGFQPCTSSSRAYDYPLNKPLLRFLDTRGLAEAEYDAKEDIAACEICSHALIIVMKIDDPEQSELICALEKIRESGKINHIIVIHTGVFLVRSERERQQAISYNQQQIEKVLGKTLTYVELDIFGENGDSVGLDNLRSVLTDIMPIIAQVCQAENIFDKESSAFSQVRNDVLWYAGAAAAGDILPVAGVVAVPTIQGVMFNNIARQYGLEWNFSLFSQLLTALGIGFATQYLTRFGVREIFKLIPIYGQTIGVATAASMSFASTYALGRVAAKYFYHNSNGEVVSQSDLQDLYKSVFIDSISFKKQ